MEIATSSRATFDAATDPFATSSNYNNLVLLSLLPQLFCIFGMGCGGTTALLICEGEVALMTLTAVAGAEGGMCYRRLGGEWEWVGGGGGGGGCHERQGRDWGTLSVLAASTWVDVAELETLLHNSILRGT